ncbi:MAG: prephenate dehydratase [Planctomycetota bacterium]|jgi:prephenate dehydratase
MSTATNKPLRLGVFGNEGSHSEAAGLSWARAEGWRLGVDFELRHLVDARGLLVALAARRVDRAVLPLHNSSAGLVLSCLEALSGQEFHATGQVNLPIRHCLCLRSKDVDPTEILAVVSHPQALAQCTQTLDELFPNAERVPWSDTASAARDLGTGVLPRGSTAILASRLACERFDLWPLNEDAQDDDDNRTAFVILERRP